MGAALVHFDIDASTVQEFYMKEISSMDFPQHGEVFYFSGQALHMYVYISSHEETSQRHELKKRLRYSSKTSTLIFDGRMV
jgi:aspartate/tyrosine/aromatic aminotransferase